MNDDTISRQAAIDALYHVDEYNGRSIEAIRNLPSAERRGRWVEYPIADGMNQCSVCGVLRFGESNYCPNCGASMMDEEENIPMEYYENGGI